MGVGSRDFGSVGSLNVFGKGGAAKVSTHHLVIKDKLVSRGVRLDR